ncbi:hypothetical protein MBLNU459_g6718t1 [Dothideomycetes sp. NU459]
MESGDPEADASPVTASAKKRRRGKRAGRGGRSRRSGKTAEEVPGADELQITPSIARLVLGFGERQPGLTSFSQLTAEDDFQDIAEVLRSHEQSFLLTHDLFEAGKWGQNQRLSVDVFLALAMNDHAGKTDRQGRIRHCFSHAQYAEKQFERLVFFAAVGFSETERDDYAQLTPLQRLRVSTVYMPYHWQSAETRVVPVLLLVSNVHSQLPASRAPSPNQLDYVCYVEGSSLEHALTGTQRRDVVILLWFNDGLVYLKMSELLSLPVKNRDGERKRYLSSGPEILEERRLNKMADGHVRVRLMLYPKSPACASWAAHRTLDAGQPIEALRQKLVREIASRDPVSVAWGVEYDRLL